MPASVGRDDIVTWKGQAIDGIRAQKIKYNDEVIDLSSGENGGLRVLHNQSGMRSIDITISGISKSRVLMHDAAAGGSQATGALVYTMPDGTVISGTFRATGLSEGRDFKDACTYELTLMSADEDLDYTPGA